MNDTPPQGESSLSAPSEDERILADFIRDFEQRGDVAVTEYVSRHPHLEVRIHELAQMQQITPSTIEVSPASGLATGTVVGDFTIVRKIEHGGMGEIYLARQESLKRDVAIKIVRAGRIAQVLRDRFEREQRVLARLHQSHIVPIYIGGTESQLQYFAMPYINGVTAAHVIEVARVSDSPSTPTLAGLVQQAGNRESTVDDVSTEVFPRSRDQLKASERRPPKDRRISLSRVYFDSVAEFVAEIAEGVHHAHQQGIHHRDIKPANLMIEPTGKAWIIDFGLARDDGTSESSPHGTDEQEPEMSLSGGTPAYMSPERHRAWKISDEALSNGVSQHKTSLTSDGRTECQSDVWGLGVTFYELLTLKRAFVGSIPEIRNEVLSENPPPDPRVQSRGIPRDLAAVCKKAIQKDPERRYRTSQELCEDLRRWLRGEPTSARRPNPLERLWKWGRRNKGWATAIAMFFVGSMVLLWLAQARAEERHRQLKIEASQRVRLTAHSNGWSDKAWQLLREAGRIRRDRPLRDQAAATVIGIDARAEKNFDFRSSSVAFDKQGKQVLFAGSEHRKEEELIREGARFWNIDDAEIGRQSSHLGTGPVAYDKMGRPLQMLARGPSSVVIWSLADDQLVAEFSLPNAGSAETQDDLSPVMALSPDGTMAAASPRVGNEFPKITVLWELTEGRVIGQFPLQADVLAFSPDGGTLAVSSDEGWITAFSVPEGDEICRLPHSGNTVLCMSIGRTCRRALRVNRTRTKWLLAAGDAGGTTVIWDLNTGQPVSFCFGGHHGVHAVALSPDGTTLAAGGRGDTKIWDMRTGRLLLNLSVNHAKDFVSGLAFSEDGKRLAISNQGPGGSIWQLNFGRGIETLRGLRSEVSKVRFSPDGKFVAALAHNWELGVWDLDTRQLVHIFETPKGLLADNADFRFSPDGKQLAFATATGAALWDVGTGQKLGLWDLPPGLVEALAFPEPNKLFLFRVETEEDTGWPFRYADPEKHPRMCRIRNLLGAEPMRPLKEIDEFNRRVTNAKADPQGRFFIVCGSHADSHQDTFSCRAYDAGTGDEIWDEPILLDPHAASALCCDPTGQYVAVSTGGQSYLARLLRMPSGASIGYVGTRDLLAVCLAPAAKYWIGPGAMDPAGRPRGYSLHAAGNHTPLVTLGVDLRFGAVDAQFSVDGKHFAWGEANGVVYIANLVDVQRRLAELRLDW